MVLLMPKFPFLESGYTILSTSFSVQTAFGERLSRQRRDFRKASIQFQCFQWQCLAGFVGFFFFLPYNALPLLICIDIIPAQPCFVADNLWSINLLSTSVWDDRLCGVVVLLSPCGNSSALRDVRAGGKNWWRLMCVKRCVMIVYSNLFFFGFFSILVIEERSDINWGCSFSYVSPFVCMCVWFFLFGSRWSRSSFLVWSLVCFIILNITLAATLLSWRSRTWAMLKVMALTSDVFWSQTLPNDVEISRINGKRLYLNTREMYKSVISIDAYFCMCLCVKFRLLVLEE